MQKSRRDLLKSAVAGGLTMGVLSKASAMPTDRPDKWDASYDVVVVGAGGAGLAAAAHAAEQGLKVLLLEKLAFVGGSSAICGGGSTVACTEHQKKLGIKDSKEQLYRDIMKVGGNLNDPKVVQTFTDHVLEVYNWFMAHGGKLNKEHLTGNVSVPRNHQINPGSVLSGLQKLAESKGVKIMTSTPAVRLAYDSKKHAIVGVYAKSEEKEMAIEAKNGVILTSGGFARNKKMLAQYVPRMANTLAICGMGSDGDGLKMAQAYGADVADMPYIKATFAFNTKPQSISDSAYPFWLGGIVVNKAGKRFVNESIPKKDVGDYVLEQEGGIGYIVYDEPVRQESLKAARNNGSVLQSEERGLVFKGQTIGEAAAKAGLDPKVVEATVKAYNSDIEKYGEDRVFGRKHQAVERGKLRPINKPPFYVFPGTAVLLATYCGVKINEKTEVIDVFGYHTGRRDGDSGRFICIHVTCYNTGHLLQDLRSALISLGVHLILHHDASALINHTILYGCSANVNTHILFHIITSVVLCTVLADCITYHLCCLFYDRHIFRNQCCQWLTYTSKIQVLIHAKNFFDHTVHITVARAHLIDDLIDRVL